MTKNKCEDEGFVDVICKHDVIILTESWTDANSEIELSGYHCFNLYRKFKHKNAKRNSGGIVIYCRDSLLNGISIVKNHYDTIIWLKFAKSFFDLTEDLYLCAVYIWGDESPAATVYDVDLFQIIENDICMYEDMGCVMLAGDWNARIGSKCDYIMLDSAVDGIDCTDYLPDVPLKRASKDNGCNSHGTKLLDLCKSTSIRIANGRLGSDCNVGAFTYYNRQNCSIIDYLLLRECNFDVVSDFTVGKFNEYSDHAPLSFVVNCKVVSAGDSDEVFMNETVRWDVENRELFRKGLISKLPDLNKMLAVYSNNHDKVSCIDNMVETFSSIVCDVANPIFKKTSIQSSKHIFHKHNSKSKWFDEECYIAKQDYRNELRKFNNCRTNENRLSLCEIKKKYKTIIRNKQRQYKLKEASEIEKLKNGKPKDFWNKFRSKKERTSSKIKTTEFYEYFKSMFNDLANGTIIEEAENFNETHNFDTHESDNEILNLPISVQEVESAIKKLKPNKSSAPCDSLINEYFKESCDILIGHLTDMFNNILNSGYFPKCWSEGCIVPLYKKGDKCNVNNYRGITLTSNLGKIFTGILSHRIDKFCENNMLLSDAQFGFRTERSTTDAIFLLKTLIDNAFHKKERLYCAFIDLRKAFDKVNRNAMWLKLFKLGIKGKILTIIRSMYKSVKSCVKHCNSYSDFFDISIGLRQGEKLSPIMFSLFIEDLETQLENQLDSGLMISDLCIILLLFADDMLVLGKNPNDLQNSLNKLSDYCDKWGLEVNIDKSKIVVFRNRGKIKLGEHWTYKGEVLETVDCFNYLGVVFNYTGSFNKNGQLIQGKALKAMNTLISNTRKYEILPKTSMQLFDAFVTPILNYSCAVWGFNKYRELERIHLKYCKTILGVRDNASNVGVYGELGRYPLYVNRFVQIIKYWLKLTNSENLFLKAAYNTALDDCSNGAKNWLYNVKSLLERYGLGYAWTHPEQLNNTFISVFKQRIIATFIQEWHSSLQTNRVLTLYKEIKSEFHYEEYLNCISTKRNRSKLTQIRISAHNLKIHTGRYNRPKLDRHERKCTFCNKNDVEDEYHFIIKCDAYENIRKTYIKKYYTNRSSMFKFIDLLKSNKKTILNLCKYISKANEVRNNLLVS